MALLAAALNDLDVLSCDTQNAYLSAPCREKIHCRTGSDCGLEAGNTMIIKISVHGLKSSSSVFRMMLANVASDLGYLPSKADLDVCLKPATKTNESNIMLCHWCILMMR